MTVSSLLRTGAVAAALTVAAGGTVLVTAGAGNAASDNGNNRAFAVALSGANEVPTPPATTAGDEDGIGNAVVRLNDKTGELCYQITARNIFTITAAHIHEAPAGQNGDVVRGLYNAVSEDKTTVGTQTLSGCVTISATLLAEIREEPADYYFNVHSTEFRGGAVRGQLA